MLKINFPNIGITHLHIILNDEGRFDFYNMTFLLNTFSLVLDSFCFLTWSQKCISAIIWFQIRAPMLRDLRRCKYIMWNIVAYDWPCWELMFVMIQCVIICIGSTAITQSVDLFLARSALPWSDEGVDLGQSSFGHYSVPDH